MQGTMTGARVRGRPRTAWMDNIKTWTGFAMEESIKMTDDRDKQRTCDLRIKKAEHLYSALHGTNHFKALRHRSHSF